VIQMMPGRESRARRTLGYLFGASLASATVAAVAVLVALPATGIAALALLGAAIGGAFSSVIGTYALSWRSTALGTACGATAAVALQPHSSWSLVAGCWVGAAVASLAIGRERRHAVQLATPPVMVAVLHGLQLPLIVLSLAVSLGSSRPRPFVVLFTLSAFALWRLLGGECPVSCAEGHLRALRGEETQITREAGFIGHHLHRTTGIRIPSGSVSRLSYAMAALVFSWYAVQALR